MNLLQELEGKKGEVMAVAGLRYLTLRSRPMRDQFFRFIATNTPTRLLGYESHFGCEVEVSCLNKNGDEEERGRIDMVVESDSVVIGIEAKLGAKLEEAQPFKYVPELLRRGDAISSLRGSDDVQVVLVLLVPDWQIEEAEKVAEAVRSRLTSPGAKAETSIPGGKEVPIVAVKWSDLLEAMAKALDNESLSADEIFVFESWRRYVNSYLGEIEDFELLWRHANRHFPRGGSDVQKRLMSRLWQLFPYAGSQMTVAANYVGYDFCPNPSNLKSFDWYTKGHHWGWYGFINRELLGSLYPGSGQAAFCLFTDYDPRREWSSEVITFKCFQEADIRQSGLRRWFAKRVGADGDESGRQRFLWVLEEAEGVKLDGPAEWKRILDPFLAGTSAHQSG